MKRPPKRGFRLVWARECRFIRRDRLAPILIFGVPLLAYIALMAIFSNQVIRGLGSSSSTMTGLRHHRR
jgi:ABC-2 type transport system permease protein